MKPPKGVPRDEWLLAIGLAAPPRSEPGLTFHESMGHDISRRITGRDLYADDGTYCGRGSDASAAYNGAIHQRDGLGSEAMARVLGGDEGNPDAFAAGAALAMALEADA